MRKSIFSRNWSSFLKSFVFGLVAAAVGFAQLGIANRTIQASQPFSNGLSADATVVHIQEMPGRRESTTGGVSVEFMDNHGKLQQSYVYMAIAPQFHVGQQLTISYQPDNLHTVRAPNAIPTGGTFASSTRAAKFLIVGGILVLLASLCSLLFTPRAKTAEL